MNLYQLLQSSSISDNFIEQIRRSPSAQIVLAYLRETSPDLTDIPATTYTLYRQFALNGERSGYEKPYFAKRSMLTRAVVEVLLEDESQTERVHDLVWSICEETSWVLPAHEKREPTIDAPPGAYPSLVGSNSSLTREPDFVDLFAAETAASLAETVHVLGKRLAPEVVQRARHEVERHVLNPYLAYGRNYWWHTGNLNWNAVCNGAVGLAFMRLEKNPRRLAEALQIALEGFEAYIATGFEPDGGSLEGISYWNYGLLYYVALAELLREKTGGQLNLLAVPRLADIARFPLAMALSPGRYLNFGDADERSGLQPGIVQRLAERTGVDDLRGLLNFPTDQNPGSYPAAKLAIVLRDIAWWDGETRAFPEAAREDYYLPSCAIIKLNGRTVQPVLPAPALRRTQDGVPQVEPKASYGQVDDSPRGKPVSLAAKAGSNDGHHHHTDIGHFIITVGEESLLCDPGRGLYTRDYFGERRFENIFCNSFGHSVPRIGGRMQLGGPKFGGGPLAQGQIIEHGQKFVLIDIAPVYGLPALTQARRMLQLSAESGEIRLEDVFAFSGDPLEIEEAFVTWSTVLVEGNTAKVTGQQGVLHLKIEEPLGAIFNSTSLDEACRANKRQERLTRLTVDLPAGTQRFILAIIPT